MDVQYTRNTMKWLVRRVHDDEVETDLTQKDQFDNDDAGLDDTLVREALQNSLDAPGEAGGLIRVRFSVVTKKENLDTKYLRDLFNGLEAHLVASGIKIQEMDFTNPRVLLIEDFGTSGLLGAYDKKDQQNFSDFWRRHGRSHKGGGKVGRWGLGKLVYSSSSKLSAFFGLTIRPNDPVTLLMGQAVLETHSLNDAEFAPHAFFAEEGPNRFQLPSTKPEDIHAFSQALKLSRRNEPGLSIAIPYLREEITEASLIEVAIINYFFPLLTGQLVVDVGGEKIDSDSVRGLSQKYARGKIRDPELLFDFIQDSYTYSEDSLVPVDAGWQVKGILDEGSISPEALERMRSMFGQGRIVGLKVPVSIAKQDGQVQNSSFKLFLGAPEGLTRGQDLYVRGGITVPKESKFGDHRRALGLLLARDEPVSAFLGDAENPAHVRWSSKAFKLQKNYRTPAPTLGLLRNSLVQFHDLLARAVDRVDREALLDFFSTPAEASSKPAERVRRKVALKIRSQPKLLRIAPHKGGFSVVPAAPIDPSHLPLEAGVTVAYDLLSGNPFKRYSTLDFDLAGLAVTSVGASVIEQKNNELRFEIQNADFRITVDGFDDLRDLLVRAIADGA